MNKLILVQVVLITLMISSTSFAKWTKVGEIKEGDSFYLEVDRIRNHGGYVYYWTLSNYLKPTKYGDFSTKVYHQGDCSILRFKPLSYSHHKAPMGGGAGDVNNPKEDWRYPPPNSVSEDVLKYVCNRVK